MELSDRDPHCKGYRNLGLDRWHWLYLNMIERSLNLHGN